MAANAKTATRTVAEGIAEAGVARLGAAVTPELTDRQEDRYERGLEKARATGDLARVLQYQRDYFDGIPAKPLTAKDVKAIYAEKLGGLDDEKLSRYHLSPGFAKLDEAQQAIALDVIGELEEARGIDTSLSGDGAWNNDGYGFEYVPEDEDEAAGHYGGLTDEEEDDRWAA